MEHFFHLFILISNVYLSIYVKQGLVADRTKEMSDGNWTDTLKGQPLPLENSNNLIAFG